ncbi:hypothetical protein ACFL4T_13440 [candidate division KSB1 bacterium]
MKIYLRTIFIVFVAFIIYCGGSKELTVSDADIVVLNTPVLSVGDEFIYSINYTFNPLYFRSSMKNRIMETAVVKEIFKVSKVIPFNEREVFVVDVECYDKDDNKTLDYMIYINKSDGKIAKNSFADNASLEGFRPRYTEILGFYDPWMLKLSPGYKFTIKNRQMVPVRRQPGEPSEPVFADAEKTYNVKRIENIEGRKCFEVEAELKFPIRQQAGEVKYDKMKYKYYIDLSKRIMVKQTIEYDATREKTLVGIK